MLRKQTLWTATILLLLITGLGEAHATHFRGGFITWEKVSGNTVKFKVRHAWRSTAVDSVNLNFGDGTFSGFQLGTQVAQLTDLSGNQYRVYEFELQHTYPAANNYTVSYASCCRISNLTNGANGNFRVSTSVNLASGQLGSSVMSLPFVLEVDNGPNTIAFSPIDADGPLSCRWATVAESGISLPPATMTSNCQLIFDGTGKAHGTIYAGQIMIDQGGALTAYDMMFQVNANLTNQAPTCQLNGSSSNTISVGQLFSISVTGTDPENGSLVVNNLGLPTGATLTPADNSTGASPMTATFKWTPTVIGQSAVTILFRDNANQSCQANFTMDVINPNAPPVADAGADASISEGNGYTLNGSGSYDPNNDNLTYNWMQIAGVAVSLSAPNILNPSFVAPWLNSSETLTFKLEVSDGQFSSTDEVNITVIANNHPPVADAGDNGMIKEGATKTLNGALTYDPDNEPVISYKWTQVSGPIVTLLGDETTTPSFSAPFGTAGQSVTFQLKSTDGKEWSKLSSLPDPNISGDDLVTINIVENSAPVADAGSNQSKNEGSIVQLDGSASFDPDNDSITYAWIQKTGPAIALSDASDAKPTFKAPWVSTGGQVLVFKLIVTDNDSDRQKSSTPKEVTINVLNENDPPSCALAQPSVNLLWPPNHTMQRVSIMNVVDVLNDTVNISITGVTQDEPINGTGDGDTSPDAFIDGSKVLLRAERAGTGDGRVYRIEFIASDDKESCTGAINVSVPHSRNSKAVDSGQSVNSLIQP